MPERKSIYRKEVVEGIRQITNDLIVDILNDHGDHPDMVYRARRLAQYSQQQKERIARM